MSGLKAAGCEVVPIDARFPGATRVANALRMSWTDQAASRVFTAACGATANRALQASGDLDGAVMIGSGYTLKTEVPVTTFEDMTVAQALRRSDPAYESLSDTGANRWRQRQRSIYESSRACCVASGWAAASVREDYAIPASKVHVVGFGRNAKPDAVQRDWSVPRFLWVGADWERKRGQAVLDAFAEVKRLHPDATLDLVGGHPSVDMDGVTAHGTLPLSSTEGQRKYSELIRQSTCFLMPSTYEPFGIAYLDAGASGLPSIGTTVGGAADAIGGGGMVVDPDDEKALPAAMLELAHPGTARRLGERAEKRSELFTWRQVGERMLRALRPAGVDVERLAGFLAPATSAEDPV
jgi:glycosyltransferase involved in cell wall biosynthesis